MKEDERDDALHIERASNGWECNVYIANPTASITEAILTTARKRLRSEYAPRRLASSPENVVQSMLPREIVNRYSLSCEQEFDVIVASINIDRLGNVKSFSLRRASETFEALATYDAVNEIMRTMIDPRYYYWREFRLMLEAFSENKNNTLRIPPHHFMARKMVEGLMTLANFLVAQYASINEIPLIYRNCDEKASHSLVSSGHTQLGVASYAQFTSPLRRFADLVNVMSLDAHLRGEEFEISPESVDAANECIFIEQQESRVRKGRESPVAQKYSQKELSYIVRALAQRRDVIMSYSELLAFARDKLSQNGEMRQIAICLFAIARLKQMKELRELTQGWMQVHLPNNEHGQFYVEVNRLLAA
ncbi:MAG: RNB domain-containing ribonuclease [bacterium]|nr:RNB domain-containing ribonuclease [bacterium]